MPSMLTLARSQHDFAADRCAKSGIEIFFILATSSGPSSFTKGRQQPRRSCHFLLASAGYAPSQNAERSHDPSIIATRGSMFSDRKQSACDRVVSLSMRCFHPMTLPCGHDIRKAPPVAANPTGPVNKWQWDSPRKRQSYKMEIQARQPAADRPSHARALAPAMVSIHSRSFSGGLSAWLRRRCQVISPLLSMADNGLRWLVLGR